MKVGTDEVHEFLTGVLIFEERAGELGGGSDGILFLDTAHGHAEVLGFNHHSHAKRIEDLLKTVLDLRGEPFLQLKSACVTLHHAWDFAQSHNSAVGNVTDVRFAKEREQMVFAKRVYFNVLDHDNLFVILVEKSGFQYFFRILTVSMC